MGIRCNRVPAETRESLNNIEHILSDSEEQREAIERALSALR
jgi:hypothetical protein